MGGGLTMRMAQVGGFFVRHKFLTYCLMSGLVLVLFNVPDFLNRAHAEDAGTASAAAGGETPAACRAGGRRTPHHRR